MRLGNYFESIKRYPILISEEQLELLKEARKGDFDSREKLINSNLRLVISLAKRYISSSYNRKDLLMELISDGNLALIEAIDTYNTEKEVKLSTYAAVIIERRIWDYLNNQNLIKVPPDKKRLLSQIYRIREDYYKEKDKNEGEIEYIVKRINEGNNKKNTIKRKLWK
ncbi:MAG: sigma-70 family RNA polymerase sigma factor [Candidatus Pacearchaeota archaeon]